MEDRNRTISFREAQCIPRIGDPCRRWGSGSTRFLSALVLSGRSTDEIENAGTTAKSHLRDRFSRDNEGNAHANAIEMETRPKQRRFIATLIRRNSCTVHDHRPPLHLLSIDRLERHVLSNSTVSSYQENSSCCHVLPMETSIEAFGFSLRNLDAHISAWNLYCADEIHVL